LIERLIKTRFDQTLDQNDRGLLDELRGRAPRAHLARMAQTSSQEMACGVWERPAIVES